MEQPYGRPLYDFAYVHNIDERLQELADLAEDENWNYIHTETEHPNPILYYYLHYTFERIHEQGKIAYAEDGQYACFNTGLVTDNQEEIFALFAQNKEPDREPWRFVRFVRGGEFDLTRFPELPDIATYFDDPSQLVYDSKLELRVNIAHILGDQRDRFPDPFRQMEDHNLRDILAGAIESAKNRVRRNYKTAVPQFYRGNIQLLMPICLSNPKAADLGLVAHRFGGFYRAATVITLDMAYNNARQLARPDADWLQP